jgi:mRNA turnover protein 4
MPKSKRAQVVHLTKTNTDRRALKRELAQLVQESVDEYDSCYVFSFGGLRSNHFKELRAEWSDSRFLLGKNKVLALALTGGEGSAPYRPGLDALAGDIRGNVGLLFTSRPSTEVRTFFDDYSVPDFARSGFVPNKTIVLSASRLTELPHTMADQLKKLGVPVRLDKGVVVITEDCNLCLKGVPITPEQGRLLKIFGHELAEFKITLVSVWQSSTNPEVVQALSMLKKQKALEKSSTLKKKKDGKKGKKIDQSQQDEVIQDENDDDLGEDGGVYRMLVSIHPVDATGGFEEEENGGEIEED